MTMAACPQIAPFPPFPCEGRKKTPPHSLIRIHRDDEGEREKGGFADMWSDVLFAHALFLPSPLSFFFFSPFPIFGKCMHVRAYRKWYKKKGMGGGGESHVAAKKGTRERNFPRLPLSLSLSHFPFFWFEWFPSPLPPPFLAGM